MILYYALCFSSHTHTHTPYRLTFSYRRSFTLIELLVVIAIIGLLAAMAIVALSNARVKARDSRREADIKQITNALELAFAFNDSYPIPTGNTTLCLSDCTASNWCANLKTQMSNIPPDPLSNQQCYLYNSDGSNFRVAAKLESSSNYDLAQSDGGLYPQFFEGQSTPGQILLTAYKSVWPSSGLSQLDPNYSSLVGWWDFEEGTGGAGATTADFSSSINTGTLSTPAPSWQTQCTSGECLNFDGSGKRVTLANPFGQTGYTTASLWYKRSASGANNFRSLLAHASANIHHLIINNPGTGTIGVFDGGLPQFNYTPPDDGGFHNYVVIYNNALTATLYVDGGYNSQISTTLNLVTYPIGVIGNWTGGYWAGPIDDVRIYNRALTASQICHLCKEKKSASFCNGCSE